MSESSVPSAMESPTESPTAVRRENIVRRMYRWVLHWAETPYGMPALFAISFAEASFFPIPPDVLQIALSVSKPRRSFLYAAVSATASVLGGIFGWFIGLVLWAAVGRFFMTYVPGMSQENIEYVGGLYRDNAFVSIFAAAFTPIPFKVFTVSAGIFHDYVSLSTLIAASVLGRSARFFAVATCIYLFGPTVKDLLEKYFEVATVALLVMLVAGFAAIKLLF